jgi:hypothetical protein
MTDRTVHARYGDYVRRTTKAFKAAAKVVLTP